MEFREGVVLPHPHPQPQNEPLKSAPRLGFMVKLDLFYK